MRRPSTSQLRAWHESNHEHYDALGRVVVSSLKSLIAAASIPFLSVSYRVKSAESFVKKAKKKKYADPIKECTDVLGVRVITYIESDVNKVSEILRSSFLVDQANSLDKSALLEVDRIGYRSVHFIASLGDVRSALPEFARFKATPFEVQIRTVLQHAWAEIEHDRNYKLPTALPPELERRLFLIAGVLELADREFNGLATDIDAYTKSVSTRTTGGDLDIEINTPSLRVYCDRMRAKFARTKIHSVEVSTYDDLVKELHEFGLLKLRDVESMITPAFLQAYDRADNKTNDLGILRDAMMYSDIERYFADAWKRRWASIEPEDLAPLADKYGKRARELMTSHRVDIERLEDIDLLED